MFHKSARSSNFNLWKLGKCAVSQDGDVAQKFMDTVTEEEETDRETKFNCEQILSKLEYLTPTSLTIYRLCDHKL